jgi:DUF1365 family protein
MKPHVDHIEATTYHGRKGGVKNAFRYSIDYVILDAEQDLATPSLFRRNGRALAGISDTDHGGAPGAGTGAAWVRDVLQAHQISGVAKIELLAQPKLLGHVFNPVSFWVCSRADDAIITVIAEVTNTFGERHSYLCAHGDLRPILPSDRMQATKIFYVSPFQPIEGGYEFRFDITQDRIGIWIDYTQTEGGLVATLTGKRQNLSNKSVLRMLWRRPFGSRRVLALIHWQALKLALKRVAYRVRPKPPEDQVSRGWSSSEGVPGE